MLLRSRSPKQIRLSFQHPREKWDGFLGVKLDESSYDLLVDEDADVFTPEGALLFRFRKGAISPRLAVPAFNELVKIRAKSMNRGTAAGKLYMPKEKIVRKDGRVSNTHEVLKGGAVNSAIIGYFDRYPRTPYCRETAYNADHPEAFGKQILPFLRAVDVAYEAMDGERYGAQKDWVDRTSKDFVISGTTFTTITVNQNFQTAVHTDQGDLKAGLSNILVLRSGDFNGGNLVFPHYRAAARLDSCDLMLFDSHHMHGNTPIYGKTGDFRRVSLVCYYRERMIDCGSATQELERAKRRAKGDALHGKIEA